MQGNQNGRKRDGKGQWMRLELKKLKGLITQGDETKTSREKNKRKATAENRRKEGWGWAGVRLLGSFRPQAGRCFQSGLSGDGGPSGGQAWHGAAERPYRCQASDGGMPLPHLPLSPFFTLDWVLRVLGTSPPSALNRRQHLGKQTRLRGHHRVFT